MHLAMRGHSRAVCILPVSTWNMITVVVVVVFVDVIVLAALDIIDYRWASQRIGRVHDRVKDGSMDINSS